MRICVKKGDGGFLDTKLVAGTTESVIEEVSKAIVGKEEVLWKVLAAIFANGHILLEDFPGLAKTLLARSLATTLGCDFRRIQFTPDLLPSDITGGMVLNRKTNDFELRTGPLFTNLLLADEINRAPPKTQSALLEAMQERQITIDGDTHPLKPPFIAIATQNPIEYQGTYPLPEAQLDRFLIRTAIGYPEKSDEIEILKSRRDRGKDDFDLKQVVDAEGLIAVQAEVEQVHVSDEMDVYITEIVRGTRGHTYVEIGASPRGAIALMKMGMAMAAMSGRDFVVPDDVKEVSVAVLSHRLILKPDPWLRGVKTEEVVQEVVNSIPVPKVK